MNTLTISYLTSREQPHFEWFFQSLARQNPEGVVVNVIDFHAEKRQDEVQRIAAASGVTLGRHIPPKPTIWQGPHRITKEDWWAKSNAHNTAICLCRTPYIAFVDDRCVLVPGWLDRVRASMAGNYAVCGYYEKRRHLKVENGGIVDYGVAETIDHRFNAEHQYPRPTHHWYGGHCALPLEWCLRVNGYSEDYCDSVGLEDCVFGHTLRNSGYQMRYDSNMRIIEDRTPGELDGALKRADKGVSPNDKSHAIFHFFVEGQKTSANSFDITALRYRVLAGEPFPPPSASHLDWYDKQPISEME